MRLTLDQDSDCVYVKFGQTGTGEAVTQVISYTSAGRYEVVLDLDVEGRLLGLEVIGALEAFRPEALNEFGKEES